MSYDTCVSQVSQLKPQSQKTNIFTSTSEKKCFSPSFWWHKRTNIWKNIKYFQKIIMRLILIMRLSYMYMPAFNIFETPTTESNTYVKLFFQNARQKLD